jgi:mycofactocin system glycosyltransferase
VTSPWPDDLDLTIDGLTREVGTDVLVGGDPLRVLRLSPRGQQAWREIRADAERSDPATRSGHPGRSRAAGLLARRLVDAGLAHPRPAGRSGAADITVVIPVRDRATEIDRCLDSLGGAYRVVVVDDGSSDPAAVDRVARRHGAAVVRRPDSGGPAAARNRGLAETTSDLVVLLDSDRIASPDWIERLVGHFADAAVAAVAPRVRSNTEDRRRYAATHGVLDLGSSPGQVQAYGRIGYVPTAALVVRRVALLDVARSGVVFDEGLPYGEDVDLVWRLDDAGWRVRYDPTVEVRHDESGRWIDRVRRRYRYGTSAGPLARRHPDRIAPAVLAPWPTAFAVGLLLRRPALLAAGVAGTAATTMRARRRHRVPVDAARRQLPRTLGTTWVNLSRCTTQFAWPLAAVPLLPRRGESAATRWSRRAAVAALLAASPLEQWRSRDAAASGVPLGRFVAGRLVDDAAYGTGVVASCVSAGSTRPLRPIGSRSVARARAARSRDDRRGRDRVG